MPLDKLFIITGDYSGDIHAGHVVTALKQQVPHLEVAAVGGAHLQAAGATLLSDQRQMGKVGISGLRTMLTHYRLGRRILKFLSGFQPDAVLLIDYGGFNLWMAQQLKKAGYKVFYFIPPQVWASRKRRIGNIKAYVDHVFCIFPFEVALYRDHGIPVTYVGHPLVGQLPAAANRETFCQQHQLDPKAPIIALFPGSRRMELHYLLPPILQALPLIQKQYPQAQFVLAQAGSISDAMLQQTLQVHLKTLSNPPEITCVAAENHALMSVADALVIKSGTGTLEAALYGSPMVIIYKVHPFVYWVGRRLIYLPCLGLPNILTTPHQPPIQELLQKDASPERIAESVLTVLDSNSTVHQVGKEACAKIQAMLSQGNAAENVAAGMLALLTEEGSRPVLPSECSQP